MSAARSAVLFVLCFSLSAAAQTRTLAVYSGNAQKLDSVSSHFLEKELSRVLSPAGIELAWRDGAKKQGERQEAGYLVVGSFAGNCSMETVPSYISNSIAASALADTSVSNNRVLPYFRVDCDRIIRTLAPMLQYLSVPSRQALLGRAMARVIAHEIYHILAQTQDHAEGGLAKPQLSMEELAAGRFDLNKASLVRMQMAFSPRPATVSADIAAVFSPAR